MMNKSSTPEEAPLKLLTENSILGFAALFVRARRFVFITCLAVAIVSGVVSFLLPKWYASTVTILPPRESGLLGSLGTLGSALKEFAPIRSLGGLAGARGGQYNYLSILDSRSAKEAVIRQFDLMRVYEVSDSSMEKAIKALDENVEVEVADEGHVRITVFDTNPVRAAEMANYYVQVLNDINTNLNYQGSSKYREFMEKGVQEAKDSLRVYEEAFRNFQKQSGIIAVPEDVQSGAKALAQLYSEKTLREMEVEFLSRVMGPSNPELQRKQMELGILNSKLKLMPDIGLEQWRIYRNIVIQARILEVFIPLYEQARLEEKKETPSVAVLDKAVPAERKAKPKRLSIIGLSILSAAFLSLSLFAVWERLKRMKAESPERYELLRSLFTLKTW